MGADGALRQQCAHALGGLGRVYAPEDADRPHRPDLVLMCFAPGDLAGAVQRFAQQLAAQPATPVLLLGQDVPVDLAVELLRLGATDFLALPLQALPLRRKVERTLLGRAQPAFDWPELAPLRVAEEEQIKAADQKPLAQNRRRCFRALIPSDMTLQVSLPQRGEDLRLIAEELSVPMDGHRGGLRLRTEGVALARLPAMGSEVQARFHLEDDPRPLPGQLRLVRLTTTMGRSGPVVWLGAQYQLTQPKDEDQIQRFWVKCQRQTRSKK